MNKLLIILLLISLEGMAQVIPRADLDVETLLGRLISTEDENFEDVVENLYLLYQEPLDLNRAERADFAILFFLSERQINEILSHRKQYGPFLSLYELQALESFTLDDIRSLLPFITVSEGLGDLRLKSLYRRATEHYMVLRADQTLEKSKGFSEDIYKGSPQRIYFRYRFSRSKDFSLGFISEKDPGETNILDYTAFHLQLQNKGKLKNLVIGDYLLQFGQGMIFSGGYFAGKVGEPVYSTRRSNLGIRPYSSLIENSSFRGAAATYQIGQIELTGMVSSQRRDATLNDSPEEGAEIFSSLQTSGLHRTASELSNHKALKETDFGANVLYKFNHLQLGFSLLSTHFNKNFQKRDLPYTYFEFSGKQNIVAGPNLSISWNNFNFFGEAARSSSGGFGYLTGLVGSLSRQVEWAFNVRNYQPNFHTLYGKAFSENSRTINEAGVYNGLKYIIKKGLEVTSYYDHFSFPWLKYRVDAPSKGDEYMVRINFQPNKKFSSFVAYKNENKEQNPSGNNGTLRSPVDTQRQTLVLNSSYSASLYLKLQSRVQHNMFKRGKEGPSRGFAFIQDVEARLKKIQIKTRVAYFATDSYDSRMYAYENDVLYAVSFPAYYGRGFRYYLVSKIPLGSHLDFWIRLARTQVNDRETMGSGYDQIAGNAKTDIKLQLKVKL